MDEEEVADSEKEICLSAYSIIPTKFLEPTTNFLNKETWNFKVVS